MEQIANTWDVFISHASEDKPFADRVAYLLKEAGLKIWYDTYILKIGDSLSEQINDGLANSNFGIVIMSRSFFAKDWPKRELAAMFNIEIDNKKVILPIWHDITKEEIRKISPLLLDKLASSSEKDGLDKIVHDMLKVIKPEMFEQNNFSQNFLISYDNNTEMVLLPFAPYNGYTIAVSKYPVTNYQYKQFVKKVDAKIIRRLNNVFAKELKEHNINGIHKPTGRVFKNGGWVGPFCSWDDEQFNDDEQPVVCVSLIEAIGYTYWLNTLPSFKRSKVVLLSPQLWNYAAIGKTNLFYHFNSSSWLNQTKTIHHNSKAPLVVFNEGERVNLRGISDMFGNIWEWCSPEKRSPLLMLGASSLEEKVTTEVKGGGYLENFDLLGTHSFPSLSSQSLKDGIFTKHSDLGFRIAVFANIDELHMKVKQYLWSSKESSLDFFNSYFFHKTSNHFYGDIQ